jgi:polyisoprenoid-binding protein YceI
LTTLQTWLADPGSAGSWTLAADRSTVGFSNRSFWGLVPVKGTFTDVSGDGRLTADGTVIGRLDIGAASLHTGIRKRDNHLRSADFFDVARCPRISVEVTALQPAEGSSADLRATLCVKGHTEALPLRATVHIGDDGAVRISARTSIDRTRWDVTGNLLGMVTNTTTLDVDAVFVKST